jgi:3-dehydroquinate synthase
MKSKLTYLKKLELYKSLDDFRDGEFFAVADYKVKNHLPQWIQFSPHVFWLKEPESDKNLETYGRALEFFIKQGIHRQSHLYAFGGGATTDFAGYVAATILRGISWSAVPTTLLAMVDGSIGGKVALNLPQGKNLVGAFHEPREVFICSEFLTTLPEDELFSGKGEILKYGFLSNDVSDLILKKASLEEIIIECAKFKYRVVEKDLNEKGERIYLNLGHTLGHAFESTLKISHGQAVAMGLKYLLKVMNLREASDEWNKLAEALNLPLTRLELSYYPQFEFKPFWKYLEVDKKKVNSSIRLVLVNRIGSCYVEEVPMKEFKTKIEKYDEFKA